MERFLRSGDGEAAVREADARARACDIDSPPHFLINAALPYPQGRPPETRETEGGGAL